MNDSERLSAYDSFAADVRSELEDVSRRMMDLRAAGKVKSATYRQLYAIRATLREIDRRLRDQGL